MRKIFYIYQKCSKCQMLKPVFEFYRMYKNDGWRYQGNCKTCNHAIQKEYREKKKFNELETAKEISELRKRVRKEEKQIDAKEISLQKKLQDLKKVEREEERVFQKRKQDRAAKERDRREAAFSD